MTWAPCIFLSLGTLVWWPGLCQQTHSTPSTNPANLGLSPPYSEERASPEHFCSSFVRGQCLVWCLAWVDAWQMPVSSLSLEFVKIASEILSKIKSFDNVVQCHILRFCCSSCTSNILPTSAIKIYKIWPKTTSGQEGRS